jgi:hypothetical protein
LNGAPLENRDQTSLSGGSAKSKTPRGVFACRITDSVLPIVEAKRAQIVKSDFALNELIQFSPTPGHMRSTITPCWSAGPDTMH